MPMRKLSMRKIKEVLRLHYESHVSQRSISKSLGISVSTVCVYLKLARTAGITWPLPDNLDEESLYQTLYRPVEASKKERLLLDLEAVYRELRRKGVTRLLLWREYRDKYPDGLSYTQFCVKYRAYVKQAEPVMRQIHKAGEKCFVDYSGLTMPWISMDTGEIHEAQIFVGTLGASSYTYVEASATQNLEDWINAHINLLKFFGGCPSILVPDNLRSGVKNAHLYDPDINPNYQCFGEHYGIAIVPARVAEPKDKAKVESAVGFVERTILAPLRNHTFTSIDEINNAIKPLLAKLNDAPFQKLPGTRKQLFESLDKPALKSFPEEHYEYAIWKKARVHIDYHIEFEKHYYSVPYKHISHNVELRVTRKLLEVFYKSRRIAAHVRHEKPYEFTTIKEHMPKSHQFQREASPELILKNARKIGESTLRFVENMVANRAFPEQAYRACLGVLRLGKRFGEDRLEKACAYADAVGAYRYKQVESILKKGLENLRFSSASQNHLPPHHENVRGAIYYR